MMSLLLTLVLGFASDSCNNKDIILTLGYNYCMAGNFRGAKFSWLSSGKHFAKKFSRFSQLSNPQSQFIGFIVRSRGMGFEIESMVRGYHCYNAIWDGTIGKNFPASWN